MYLVYFKPNNNKRDIYPRAFPSLCKISHDDKRAERKKREPKKHGVRNGIVIGAPEHPI
jgi:hypothetical protein